MCLLFRDVTTFFLYAEYGLNSTHIAERSQNWFTVFKLYATHKKKDNNKKLTNLISSTNTVFFSFFLFLCFICNLLLAEMIAATTSELKKNCSWQNIAFKLLYDSCSFLGINLVWHYDSCDRVNDATNRMVFSRPVKCYYEAITWTNTSGKVVWFNWVHCANVNN